MESSSPGFLTTLQTKMKRNFFFPHKASLRNTMWADCKILPVHQNSFLFAKNCVLTIHTCTDQTLYKESGLTISGAAAKCKCIVYLWFVLWAKDTSCKNLGLHRGRNIGQLWTCRAWIDSFLSVGLILYFEWQKVSTYFIVVLTLVVFS